MMHKVQVFSRHEVADREILACLRAGIITQWRKAKPGQESQFRVVDRDEFLRRVNARKYPEIRQRDLKIRQRLAAGEVIEFLPASAIGEDALRQLLASGRYAIWRVDGGGCLWLRLVVDE